MDDIDRASDREELDRAAAISAARASTALPSIGACYFCNEPLFGGARFCDKDCCEDYEREQSMKRMNGG